MLKESVDLDILGVIFDSKILLRSIFTQFPEQLLRGLVSLESPGEYFMISCSLGDTFGVLSYPFWSTILHCGARLLIHT